MLPILIENLTSEIQKLPGVGKRGAQKMALDILQHSEVNFENLNQAIHKMRQEVFFCDNCGFFADNAKFDHSQNNFANPFSLEQNLPNPNLIPKSKTPKIEIENDKMENKEAEKTENVKISNLEIEKSEINKLKIDDLEDMLEDTSKDSLENISAQTSKENQQIANQQIALEKKLEIEVNLTNIVKNNLENPKTSTVNSTSFKEKTENGAENERQNQTKTEIKTETPNQQNLPKKSHISHSYNNYLQNFIPIPKNKLCQICQNSHRNPLQICLVEKPTDILNIEKSQIYQGFYHVLGKLISPLDRIFVENTRLPDLFDRRIPELLEILEKLNQTILPLKTAQKIENFESKNEKSQEEKEINSQIDKETEKMSNYKNSKTNLQENLGQETENNSQNFNYSGQNLRFPNSNFQNSNSKVNSQNWHQIELILFFKTGFSSEATTAYLREKIHQEGWENEIKITKLAEGLPLYYNPDNLDQATMIKALEDRKSLW